MHFEYLLQSEVPSGCFVQTPGMNFIGACKELGITPENAVLQFYLKDHGCSCSSYFGQWSDTEGASS